MLFSSVLLAVDGSEPAQHAANLAIHLVRESGAKLTCVTALDEMPTIGAMSVDLVSAEDASVSTKLRAVANAIVDAVTAQATAAGVRCEPRVIEAHPVAAILQAVGESRADLIVMGTHGRSGVERIVLGSVAESVLREATVPVLLSSQRAERAAGAAAQ